MNAQEARKLVEEASSKQSRRIKLILDSIYNEVKEAATAGKTSIDLLTISEFAREGDIIQMNIRKILKEEGYVIEVENPNEWDRFSRTCIYLKW